MGNFSRNTFDPSKNYLGVRLQQGVPLVDADWNELNDVIRHEVYEGFNSSIVRNDYELRVFKGGNAARVGRSFTNNNIYIYSGRAMVGGRPLIIRGGLYNNQALRDPVLAEAWGVDPLPDLTTPTSDRTDAVYLDIWEREIDSSEDTDLVNPVIGVETSVRIKREVTVRVNEGSRWAPFSPVGHIYITIARINRTAGTAVIENDMITDLRGITTSELPGYHYRTLPPTLLNAGTGALWNNYTTDAEKRASIRCAGLLPFSVPYQSKIWNINIQGSMSNFESGTTATTVHFNFYRALPGSTNTERELLFSDLVSNNSAFTKSYSIPTGKSRVDNINYYYILYVRGFGPGSINLRRFRILYEV